MIVALDEIIVTIGARNRVTLPVEVRQRLGVGPSDSISFLLHEDGSIEVRRTRPGSSSEEFERDQGGAIPVKIERRE